MPCRAPADRPGRFEAQLYITLAERKMRRFCQYAALYPESCFILIGDNGQVRQFAAGKPPTAQAAVTSTDSCNQGAMRGALSTCCCDMALASRDDVTAAGGSDKIDLGHRDSPQAALAMARHPASVSRTGPV